MPRNCRYRTLGRCLQNSMFADNKMPKTYLKDDLQHLLDQWREAAGENQWEACYKLPRANRKHRKCTVKAYFHCRTCNHTWASMYGVVSLSFNPATRRVAALLFGQRCKNCDCRDFQWPRVPRDELFRAFDRLRVNQRAQRARRGGKPRAPHESNECEACERGVCPSLRVAN